MKTRRGQVDALPWRLKLSHSSIELTLLHHSLTTQGKLHAALAGLQGVAALQSVLTSVLVLGGFAASENGDNGALHLRQLLATPHTSSSEGVGYHLSHKLTSERL